MSFYRKKPVLVSAVQWNAQRMHARECMDSPNVRPASRDEVLQLTEREDYRGEWFLMGVIDTLEGKHLVNPGCWIVTANTGVLESWPVQDEIFRNTYEYVGELS